MAKSLDTLRPDARHISAQNWRPLYGKVQDCRTHQALMGLFSTIADLSNVLRFGQSVRHPQQCLSIQACLPSRLVLRWAFRHFARLLDFAGD
jgi:hypothetical protein